MIWHSQISLFYQCFADFHIILINLLMTIHFKSLCTLFQICMEFMRIGNIAKKSKLAWLNYPGVTILPSWLGHTTSTFFKRRKVDKFIQTRDPDLTLSKHCCYGSRCRNYVWECTLRNLCLFPIFILTILVFF